MPKVQPYSYVVTDAAVIDGDSLEVTIDLGFSTDHRTILRLYGVDTPEVTSTNESERRAAELVAGFADGWVMASKSLTCLTIKPDKYGGRYDCRLFNEQNEELGTLLIAKGYARKYRGEKRKPWATAEIASILKKFDTTA